MQYWHTSFMGSFQKWEKANLHRWPEVALIGRSNVGKSSLVNALLGRKSLAKISSQPGKTRLLNYFQVNKEFFLVDLPGYGWASVGKDQRMAFAKMNRSFLMNSPNLVNLLLLIDSRLNPQAIDLECIHWLGLQKIPFTLVFTKADKLSTSLQSRQIQIFKDQLKLSWAALPPIFITSSVKKEGLEELRAYVLESIPKK